MNKNSLQSLRRLIGKSFITTSSAFCLVLLFTVSALGESVRISDRAGVLDAGQIKSEAAGLPYSIAIYTMNDFKGSKNQFDRAARREIKEKNAIVIAIETSMKHVAIVGGKDVNLTSERYNEAINEFGNDLKHGGNYTSATLASLRELRRQANESFPLLWCIVGLLAIGGIGAAAFFVLRSRRRSTQPHYDGPRYDGFQRDGLPYEQPYGQQYPPDNSPPGYIPHSPQQNQGMNPWVAGGLGAAAGGLIGYELGQHQAEQAQRDAEGGDMSGAGASGDFDADNDTFGGDFGGADFGGN